MYNNSYKKKINLYSKIIFFNFGKIFLSCFFILFLISFSLNFSLNFNQNSIQDALIISLYKTLKTATKNINIISIISCIFFISFTNKNFSITILQTFGISTKKIIRPVIIFSIFISLTNTFFLKPITIKLQNIKNAKIHKIENTKIEIPINTEFKLIDEYEKNKHMIITGEYFNHDNKIIECKNISLLEYENNKIIKLYQAKNSFFSNNLLLLKNIKLFIFNNTDKEIKELDEMNLKTNFKNDEIILKLQQEQKINKNIKLNLYDYLNLMYFYQNGKEQNKVYFNARIFLINEIINLFNSILSFLIVFLFCNVKNKNKNILFPATKSFIIYLIILRIFKSFNDQGSLYYPTLLLFLSILLCLSTYYLILNYQWGNLYYKMFKQMMLNIKNRYIKVLLNRLINLYHHFRS